MAQLKMSGYSEQDRYEILKSGFNHYNKLQSQQVEGIRPFYRSCNFDKDKRIKDKKTKKINWFKLSCNNKQQNQFSSVFFVPATPGSKLLHMLKKCEENNKINDNCRIKFIETSGRKFIDQLRVKDPFNLPCPPEEKCLLCKSSKNGTSNCKISNVGYSIKCNNCQGFD